MLQTITPFLLVPVAIAALLTLGAEWAAHLAKKGQDEVLHTLMRNTANRITRRTLRFTILFAFFVLLINHFS